METPVCVFCGNSRHIIEVERRRIRYQMNPRAAHLLWRCVVCGGRFSTTGEIPDEEMDDIEPRAAHGWSRVCVSCGGEAKIVGDEIRAGMYWFGTECGCGAERIMGGPLPELTET